MIDFFKKEKPFLGYSGFGGGAAGLAAGGIAPAGPGPTNVVEELRIHIMVSLFISLLHQDL